MAETLTPHYSWVKPDIGGDATVWGNVLNQTIDAVDSVVYANQQAGVPIGALTMWAGPTVTPPANWLICDGRTLDYGVTPAYQPLFNVIGRAFNAALTGTQFALPNLTQKFPIGAGTNPVGTPGGSFSVSIAIGNLPAHAHSITDVAHNHGLNQSPHSHPDGGHSHTINDPSHVHQNVLSPGVNGNVLGAASNFGGSGTTDARQTNISLNGSFANIQPASANISLNASGTGLSTTQPVGSGTPFSVVPPFLAINFIIRYQ